MLRLASHRAACHDAFAAQYSTGCGGSTVLPNAVVRRQALFELPWHTLSRARYATGPAAVPIGDVEAACYPPLTMQPMHFPSEEKVPEGKQHLKLRTALYQILELAFGNQHGVGSDQFVYWDPTDSRRCLAPDAFVRVGGPNDVFRIWKVWERGAPDVAVEIISATERDVDQEAQLGRYRQMGVVELVRFDCDDIERPLRIWD